MAEKKQIGRILLRQKAITPEQLDHALAEGRGRLASRLIDEGTISELSGLKALSEQHGIPAVDLDQVCIKLEDLDSLPREIAEKHLILPVLAQDDRLFLAMANPGETKVIDELEFVTGKRVYPYVALESALRRVIRSSYVRKARGEAFYVGPACPADVLARRGVDPDTGRPSDRPPRPDEHTEELSLSTPGLVVDELAGHAATESLSDEAFVDNSKELSVVTDLPEVEAMADGGAKTILVVDDEVDIRKMLNKLLSSKGYRVLEADRGKAALRLVKEHSPALIVLDAMLPEVHGFEIARRIKGSKRYGSTAIIMVSAVYRGWRYAEDLKESCGVDHFIEKPFRIADVLTAVESCFAPERAARAEEPAVSDEAERALNEGLEAYKAGRLDDAIAHLKRGIAVDPLAYRLHFHLGLLYGKRGQVFEAISQLETAVDMNSRHFAAVKNLAVLYQRAGFRNKAAETWQRALTLAPDDDTRQSIKAQLLGIL